jgi:hypothetical protein
MREIDPGHKYQLDVYDGAGEQVITFMKREGPGYPFNIGHYPGTNCQELLRVLISRVEYLNKQIPCQDNERVLAHLRYAFLDFERRGAMRHGEELQPLQLWDIDDVCPERMPHCPVCGHIRCFGHRKESDGTL